MAMNFCVGPVSRVLTIAKSLPGSHLPSVIIPSAQSWNPPPKS
ncbi:Uncharacterised protein [Mycobacterium tuberculosis]|nr:Uncharacterised protein [Mycobacterium tuberculosis]